MSRAGKNIKDGTSGILRLHGCSRLIKTCMHSYFASDIIRGLSSDKKHLPCRYLYDERGSALFSRITCLDEYYLTRCEIEIIRNYGHSIADAIGTERCNVIELGAGDGIKTVLIIRSMLEAGIRVSYVPVDISESAVKGISNRIITQFPDVPVRGIVSDYFHGIEWLSRQDNNRNMVLFLGSNIGNFNPSESRKFLGALAMALNKGDYVLIGFDMLKESGIITRAYNDSEGVTAEFILNILVRINNEFNGTFDIDSFNHESLWNRNKRSVETGLVSRKNQVIRVQDLDCSFSFHKGESIHIESSCKFTHGDISSLSIENGFSIYASFTDSMDYFTGSLWVVT